MQFICKFLESPLGRNGLRHWEHFVSELVSAEISPENNNRFVFWRLYAEVVAHVASEEDEGKLVTVINKLVDLYFKRASLRTKSLLCNKLMLFVADSLDKAVSNSNYGNLPSIQILLGRTFRRFMKETLQRLLLFFTSKTANVEAAEVKSLISFLTRISKPRVNKHGVKEEEESESGSGEEE